MELGLRAGNSRFSLTRLIIPPISLLPDSCYYSLQHYPMYRCSIYIHGYILFTYVVVADLFVYFFSALQVPRYQSRNNP